VTGVDRIPGWPLDSLVSYHYFKTDEQIGPLVASGRLRMIGDSGAFSALTSGHPIKMAEFAAWCIRWRPHLLWVAALDVIGDPAATLANWRLMTGRHGLDVVPTLHVGTDPSWLEPYVREGVDFFGLGGMVGRALQSLPWLAQVFRYARQRFPQVRFHLWGMTHVRALHNLPAYSCDSSAMSSGTRFARLQLFDPTTNQHEYVRMMRNDVYRAGELLRREYGVEPAQVERPTRENRALGMKIFCRTNQLYAAWLQQRHQVTPPTWGIRDPFPQSPIGNGTRVHAVETTTPSWLAVVADQETESAHPTEGAARS
jgi:hypothetical protein